jgi:hypothetical protein
VSAPQESSYRLKNEGLLPNAWKISAALGAVGLLLAGVGLGSNPDRFGHSFLFGFIATLTVLFGAMFQIIALHITQGHWAVTTRRITELLLSGSPVILVFGLVLLGGVATGKFHMYSEWLDVSEGGHGAAHAQASAHESEANPDPGPSERDEHAGTTDLHPPMPHHTPQMGALHHHTIQGKAPYLNKGRWLGFGAAYLLIWVGISMYFYRKSLAQDDSKDKNLTNQMKTLAPAAAVLFGLSLTFAAFDWVMSLQPGWYSTIFGVVFFGGSAMTMYAVMVLMSIALSEGGHTGDAINTEHIHDHARMMFGFMCFWTYTSFSQWMLIWYAGIPEESVFFQIRWTGGWENLSKALPFAHFAAPFVIFVSREVKRRNWAIKLVCVWLIAWHVLDIYWYVMPTGSPQFSPGIADLGCLLMVAGAYFSLVFYNMGRVSLVPVGDPRLERSLHHHQIY